MKSTIASIQVTLLFAAVIRAQDCTTALQKVPNDVADLKNAVGLLVRQQLEFAINNRVKETFDAVLDADGSFYCADGTPAMSMPILDVSGVPDGVSGPARCALYCQNFDGCISFNFFKKPLNDGTQCQLFTSAPATCKKSVDAGCQHYQATGNTASCRSRADFNYFPITKTYYKAIFEPLNWAEAADRCKQLNPFAHLAVFRSMAEFNELTSFLRTFPVSQVTACSTSVGFGADWAGWWIAKRKPTDDARDLAACKSAPMPWALDSKLKQLLPEQSWESNMFITAGFTDCSQYWKKAFTYEMCLAIPVNHGYKLNDMMCDYKMCAVCQLD